MAVCVDRLLWQPFYTAEEVASFRTLGLEPGIQLLGFKPRSELAFEDNIKHSIFIHPDEMVSPPPPLTHTRMHACMLTRGQVLRRQQAHV